MFFVSRRDLFCNSLRHVNSNCNRHGHDSGEMCLYCEVPIDVNTFVEG